MKTEDQIRAIKEALIDVLMGDGGVLARWTTVQRTAYEGATVAELIAIIDRRFAAARARSNAMTDALRIVAGGGRAKRERRR